MFLIKYNNFTEKTINLCFKVDRRDPQRPSVTYKSVR